MNEENPIDRMRNRGGSVDIGTEEDGAIMEMFTIGNRVLVIKERSVYEMRMADDIDPDRKNPNVPSSSQKLIVNLGTESEMFSRTFLTAKRLFRSENLIDSIDTTQLLFLTLEVVQELSALEKEINEYLIDEKKVSDEYEERRNKKTHHAVPAIPGLKTHCKTIFQKTDQAYQALLAIIRIFYPEFSAQSYYTNFFEFIKEKYGEDDPFTKFMAKIVPFILLARNIRNCLDHRRTETKITDFDLQVDLSIVSPTIEVDYLGSKLDRISLSQFLPSTLENLVTIIENLIPHLCAKKLKADRMMQPQIRIIPEDKRRNKFIKFAYWLPLGEGGFYQQ